MQVDRVPFIQMNILSSHYYRVLVTPNRIYMLGAPIFCYEIHIHHEEVAEKYSKTLAHMMFLVFLVIQVL